MLPLYYRSIHPVHTPLYLDYLGCWIRPDTHIYTYKIIPSSFEMNTELACAIYMQFRCHLLPPSTQHVKNHIHHARNVHETSVLSPRWWSWNISSAMVGSIWTPFATIPQRCRVVMCRYVPGRWKSPGFSLSYWAMTLDKITTSVIAIQLLRCPVIPVDVDVFAAFWW